VTLICIGAVGVGVIQELAARRRKQAELNKLDREVADLVARATLGEEVEVIVADTGATSSSLAVPGERPSRPARPWNCAGVDGRAGAASGVTDPGPGSGPGVWRPDRRRP